VSRLRSALTPQVQGLLDATIVAAEAAAVELWVVGGCIRDLAAGYSVRDIDVATSDDPGWKATSDELDLERVPGGWGNAFSLPSGAGTVNVTYPRSIAALLVLLITILAWTATVGAAFSRKRRRIKGTIA
ncbi:MAG: hypothetical protein ABI571_03160, partial [Actinomycetota bacterium]